MENDNLHDILDQLLAKYSDNEYLSMRLKHFITNILPNSMENAEKNYKEKIERKTHFIQIQEDFAQRFLIMNPYFFCQNVNLFLKYDNDTYKIYNEDDIHHEIFSNLSSNKDLRTNKQRVRSYTIKKIKERNPLHAIPESATIQNVLNYLYPYYFPSKNATKYFLTIIGDALLNKNTNNLIFFANKCIKLLLEEILHIAHTFFGHSNDLNSIKFKYHDHSYEKCRFIVSNKSDSILNVSNTFNNIALDLLCVSTHYSMRYENSDKFITQCDESVLKNHVLFLFNNTLSDIIDIFINKHIETSADSVISNKNMLFLWKKFLDNLDIPNIAFYSALQQNLKNKIEFCEDSDNFLNVTSSHLPLVSNFMRFWEINMEKDDDGEMEIGEITALFKEWSGKVFKIAGDPENEILDLIKHFYPDIIIEDDKYILCHSCKLWNKYIEVVNAIESFKLQENIIDKKKLYSLYNVYEYYSKICKRRVVSKRYFDKIAIEILGDSLDCQGFIHIK